MPRKRCPKLDREFEAAVQRFERAQRLLTVATKVGGVERLPHHLRTDLCTVLKLPVPRQQGRPALRLVIDNTTPKEI